MVMKMGKRIKITEEEYEAVKTAVKENKHKRIDKKFQIIILGGILLQSCKIYETSKNK